MLVVPPGSLRRSRRRRVVPAHLSVLLLAVFILGTSGGSWRGSAAAFSLSSSSSLSLGVQVKDRITSRAKAELLARIAAPVSTTINSNKNSNSNNRDAHEQQILQAVRKVEQYSWIVGGANLQNPLLAGNWLMVWYVSMFSFQNLR